MVVCTHNLVQRKKLIVAILSSLGLDTTSLHASAGTSRKFDNTNLCTSEGNTPDVSKDFKSNMAADSSNTSALPCPNCNKRFKLKRNLDKHLSEKHKHATSETPKMRRRDSKSVARTERSPTPNKPKSPNKAVNVSKEHENMNADFAEVDNFQLKLSTQQAFGSVSDTPKRAFLDDSSTDESSSPIIETKALGCIRRKSPRKQEKENTADVPETVQAKTTTVRFANDVDKNTENESRSSCVLEPSPKPQKKSGENHKEKNGPNEDKKKRRSEMGSVEVVGGRKRRSSGTEDDESFVSAVTNNFESTGIEDISAASITPAPVVIDEDPRLFDRSEMRSMLRQHSDEMKELKVLLTNLREEMVAKLERQEKNVCRKDQGTSVDLKSKVVGVDKATSMEIDYKNVKVQVAMMEVLEDKSTETDVKQFCSASIQTEGKSNFEARDVSTSCEGLACYGNSRTPESSRKKSKKSTNVDVQQQLAAESVTGVSLDDSFLFETQSRNNLTSQKTSSKTPPTKKNKVSKSNGAASSSGNNCQDIDARFDAPLSQNGEPFISFLQSANPEREENVFVLSSADPEPELPNEQRKQNDRESEETLVPDVANEELTDSILLWSLNLTEDESQKSKKDPSSKNDIGESSSSSSKKGNIASQQRKRKMSPEKELNNSEEQRQTTSNQNEVVSTDGQTLHKKKKKAELYEALATPSNSGLQGSEQRSGLVERNQTPFAKKLASGCQSNASDSSATNKKKGEENKYCTPLVFVTSGLNTKEINTVKKLCKKLSATFSKNFEKGTTHLIMKNVTEHPDKFIFPRTLKLLEAISMGVWIVEYQWVLKCINKEEKVPELPYEMRGDVFCGLEHRGPAKARERALTNEKLFRGFVFFCPAESPDIPLELMQKLIKNAGGIYITHREDFAEIERGKKVIIAETEERKFSVVVTKMADECGVPVVSREWFVDSLTMSQLQPTEKFAQYEPPNIAIE